MWGTLLPVIVGGGIATLGGLVGPPLTHWLLRKREREKERTQKFEELIGLVYEHDHWLDLKRSIAVAGMEDTHPIDPLPKAKAIVAMYFPDLKEDFAELEILSKDYQQWILQLGLKRIDGKIDTAREGFGDVYKPFLKRFKSLIEKLENYKY